MKKILLLIVAVCLTAPALSHAVPEGLPDIAGPDIPPVTAPDQVVTAFQDEVFTCTGASRTHPVAVPAGEWDRIILEYTYTPDGDPWDRTFHIAIDGVEVLRGTSPRTVMTLRKDLTEYAVLLPSGGTADVTLTMGTYVGSLKGTVRFEFYGDEPTGALVRARLRAAQPVFVLEVLPKLIDEVWVRDAAKPVTFGATPPVRAIAELTISSHGRDEVWFQNGLLRGFHIFVDDVEIANIRPYPYRYAFFGTGNEFANTACVGPGTSAAGDLAHPLMWWTAQRAADAAGVHTGPGEILAHRAEIDAASLPLLTGARTVRIVMEGGRPYWPISLSFLYPAA